MQLPVVVYFRWREDTIKSMVSHFLAPVMVNDKIYVARRALVLSSYQYRRQRVNCFVISLQHGGDKNIADGNCCAGIIVELLSILCVTP